MLDRLTNNVEYPILLTATCNAGAFDWIDPQDGDPPYSLAEAWVLKPAGGVVAAVSNTSNLYFFEASDLSHGFFEGAYDPGGRGHLPPFLLDPDADRTLAALAYAAYWRLWKLVGNEDATDGVHTGTILGDPATRLRMQRY